MNKNDFDKLVNEFGKKKAESDLLTKEVKQYNLDIKKQMAEYVKNGQDNKYSTNKYKITYSVNKRESMNEEKLLEIAHNEGIPEIIKTKEYIDFDALENAIYNNLLSKELIQKIATAKEVKEVETLRISEVKEDK